MGIYAGISSGNVVRLIVADSTPSTPSWADTVVEITGYDPMPQAGWTYADTYFFAPSSTYIWQLPVLDATNRGYLAGAQGVIIFNADTKKFQKNDGTGWVDF